MNTLIIIAVLAAMACAMPTQPRVSHVQNTLGNYHLKYITEDAERDEQGFEGGKVVGSYSFIDTDGEHHEVSYLAGPDTGYVAHGEDIPQETPEVAEARRRHLEIVEMTRALLPALEEESVEEVEEIVYVPVHYVVPEYHEQTLPVVQEYEYVDNTAELAAARAEHYAAHQRALAELAEAYKRVTYA